MTAHNFVKNMGSFCEIVKLGSLGEEDAENRSTILTTLHVSPPQWEWPPVASALASIHHNITNWTNWFLHCYHKFIYCPINCCCSV